MFQSLKDAIKTKRPHNYQPFIEEIDRYKLSQEDRKAFDEIKQAVEKYDFNEAFKLISLLLVSENS